MHITNVKAFNRRPWFVRYSTRSYSSNGMFSV